MQDCDVFLKNKLETQPYPGWLQPLQIPTQA